MKIKTEKVWKRGLEKDSVGNYISNFKSLNGYTREDMEGLINDAKADIKEKVKMKRDLAQSMTSFNKDELLVANKLIFQTDNSIEDNMELITRLQGDILKLKTEDDTLNIHVEKMLQEYRIKKDYMVEEVL